MESLVPGWLEFNIRVALRRAQVKKASNPDIHLEAFDFHTEVPRCHAARNGVPLMRCRGCLVVVVAAAARSAPR